MYSVARNPPTAITTPIIEENTPKFRSPSRIAKRPSAIKTKPKITVIHPVIEGMGAVGLGAPASSAVKIFFDPHSGQVVVRAGLDIQVPS